MTLDELKQLKAALAPPTALSLPNTPSVTNLQALQALLASPDYTGLSDADALTAMNTTRPVSPALVNLYQIKQLGLESGWWVNLLGAAESDNQQIRLLAQTILSYLDDPHFDHLDLANALVQQMLAQAQAAGIVSSTDMAAITALGPAPVNDAGLLGLNSVTVEMITWCRANFDKWVAWVESTTTAQQASITGLTDVPAEIT